MMIRRKANSIPVDPLMKAMARGKTVHTPEASKKTGEQNLRHSLEIQEEWRIFNISRQARGLMLVSFEEYLQMKN